jgi:ribosome-binding protein aMBF1 (putative translation factor)
MKSALSNSAKLAVMAEEKKEWISPIGQSITEVIEEEEARDPEYKRERAEMKPYREFAKLILIRRTELGLNQEALAKRMGTSHSVISRLESGRHNFSMTTLKRLAEALEMKLIYGFEVAGEDGAEPTRNLVVVP